MTGAEQKKKSNLHRIFFWFIELRYFRFNFRYFLWTLIFFNLFFDQKIFFWLIMKWWRIKFFIDFYDKFRLFRIFFLGSERKSHRKENWIIKKITANLTFSDFIWFWPKMSKNAVFCFRGIKKLKNLEKISLKIVKMEVFSEVFQKFSRSFSEIFKFFRNYQEVFQKFSRSFSEISKKFFKKFQEVFQKILFPKNPTKSSRIISKFVRKIWTHSIWTPQTHKFIIFILMRFLCWMFSGFSVIICLEECAFCLSQNFRFFDSEFCIWTKIFRKNGFHPILWKLIKNICHILTRYKNMVIFQRCVDSKFLVGFNNISKVE